jgi:hypothetical protein
MAHLNWTEQSIDDLINIADFIAKYSVKYSVIQLNRIRETAKLLRSQPFLDILILHHSSKLLRVEIK